MYPIAARVVGEVVPDARVLVGERPHDVGRVVGARVVDDDDLVLDHADLEHLDDPHDRRRDRSAFVPRRHSQPRARDLSGRSGTSMRSRATAQTIVGTSPADETAAR